MLSKTEIDQRDIVDTLGYWRGTALINVGSVLDCRAPGRTGLQVWIGLLGGKPVARISRRPGHGKGCSAGLNGSKWNSHIPESGSSQFGVKESQTRGFLSAQDAKRAITADLAVTK